MATIIIRYSNRANFVIKGTVDVTTDEVKIEDYLNIVKDKLYYHDDRYGDEVVAVDIKSPSFRRAMFGTNIYEIKDEQLEKLLRTGHAQACAAVSGYKQVYVGKFFEPVAKEVGDQSLAQCYTRIEKERAEYRKKCGIQDALLAIGSGTVTKHVECDTGTLAADIETFLKNRKKCLAALKPKKK